MKADHPRRAMLTSTNVTTNRMRATKSYHRDLRSDDRYKVHGRKGYLRAHYMRSYPLLPRVTAGFPRNGFKFYGRMRLSPDGQTLTVRGYLGIERLGGNDVWRRLPDSAYNELNPTVTAGHALRDAGPAHPPELTAFQSQSRSLRRG